MITLTGFADEISPDLEVQLDVLESEGIRHLDFRGVYNKKAAALSDDELQAIKARLAERGIAVSCVSSHIGKGNIAGDLAQYERELQRMIEIAKLLNTRYIRIFSFYYNSPGRPADYKEAIVGQLKRYIAMAEQAGVVLLHENEIRIYGDNLHNCLELFESCPSPSFRAILDPANFLRTGVKPATHAYPLLKPYLAYYHVKDSRFIGTKYKNVPAGEGDGEWKQLAEALKRDGFSGFLSIEPHLQPRSPESFRKAARAIKTLLGEAGLEWN